MRVAVTGSTGFVGHRLVEMLAEAGHEPQAWTRDAEKARSVLPEGTDILEVDLYDVDSVQAALAGCQAVVHLAGANVFAKRWSKSFKKEILDSRVETTKAIVQAIARMEDEDRPEVLVNSSAVGIYGPRDPDEAIAEDRLDAGRFAPGDFLADVCQHWERAASEAERSGVRVVRLRTGVVLGAGGGALKELERPFKLFVGGPVGSGKHVMSWIHRDDLCRLIQFCIEQGDVSGPVNATAPNPVTNKEFSKALGQALHRPSLLPVPPPALRLVLGEVASMVTTGQRAVPQVALDHGFEFRYPTVQQALSAVYDK